jgi:hypothetical protein
VSVCGAAACESLPAVGILVRTVGGTSQDPGNPWVNIIALRTDGVLFVNGQVTPDFMTGPVPRHAVVTVTLNLPARTLAFALNNCPVGRSVPIPDSLLSVPLQPVVVFDATLPSCTVSILSFQRLHQPVNAVNGASVYLCDVVPDESTLGRGELGVGTDLGLLPEVFAPPALAPPALTEAFSSLSNALTGSGVVDSTPSSVCQHRQVCVGNGSHPEFCVVMAPPDEGAASAVYPVSKAFEQLTFRVAIPDYITETLSPMTFRVLGDGKQLWSSQPMERLPGTPNVISEEFSVSLSGVDQLTLVLASSGVAALSQGVWVDPVLKPITSSVAAAASRPAHSVTLELDELQFAADEAPLGVPVSLSRSHVQCALEVLRQATSWTVGYFSESTVVSSPWWHVDVRGQAPLMTKYTTDTFDVVRTWRGDLKRADPSNPLEPFCCEPFADVLETALSVLRKLHTYTHDPVAAVDPHVKLGALLLEIETLKHVKVMLQPFVNASPETLAVHGFNSPSPFAATQEVVLSFVHVPNASGHYVTVTRVAMDIVTQNVSVFYPTTADVIALYDRLAASVDGSKVRLLDAGHPLFGVVIAAFAQFRQTAVTGTRRATGLHGYACADAAADDVCQHSVC